MFFPFATLRLAALQLLKGPDMPSFPTIAPAFLEEMVAHLLHLFIRGAGGDEAAARYAVLSTLAAYDQQTSRNCAWPPRSSVSVSPLWRRSPRR